MFLCYVIGWYLSFKICKCECFTIRFPECLTTCADQTDCEEANLCGPVLVPTKR